jgi:ubiquinone/menaquinone biosynthesis C-methylase UbiE
MDSMLIRRVKRSRQQAKSAYDHLSRWYDWLAAGYEERPRAAAVHRLDVQPGDTVLEIGCGTGRSLVQMGGQLAASGVILGIDLSRGMLRVARRRLQQRGMAQQISLHEADGLNLPLAAARFDRLLMTFTLELFDTPEIPRVLAECARVLRREGRLCVLSLSREGGPNTLTRLYEWAHDLIPQYADCRPIYVQQALESAGFRILRAGTISLGGLQAEEVLAQPPA